MGSLHGGIIGGQHLKKNEVFYQSHSQRNYWGPGTEIWVPLTGVLLGARFQNMGPTRRGIIGGQGSKYGIYPTGVYSTQAHY